jgi:Spy/CpxP family protein refolding chaperone
MYRRISIKPLGFTLCVVLGCALAVCAQQQPMGGQGHRHGPRDMVQMRLNRMSRVLNLTSDQKAKIKPILEDESSQMRTIFQNQSLSREDRHSKFMALQRDTEKKIEPILTKDQLPKLKEAMAPPHHGRHHGPPNGSPSGQQS